MIPIIPISTSTSVSTSVSSLLSTATPTTVATATGPLLMMNTNTNESRRTNGTNGNSNNNTNNNNNNNRKRGAFIVFEGIDRCGKTTQSTKLVSTLQSLFGGCDNTNSNTNSNTTGSTTNKNDFDSTSITESTDNAFVTKLMRFPDRTTATGQIINKYLQQTPTTTTTNTSSNTNNNNNDTNIFDDDHAIHLLFSANRWESAKTITDTLLSGTTIICDRYAHSGVAFSSAKVVVVTDEGGTTTTISSSAATNTNTVKVQQDDDFKENNILQNNNNDSEISVGTSSPTTIGQDSQDDVYNKDNKDNNAPVCVNQQQQQQQQQQKHIPLLDLDWCIAPDRGLPSPDCILFLDISPNTTKQRCGYGNERYEQYDMQVRVRQQFFKLYHLDNDTNNTNNNNNNNNDDSTNNNTSITSIVPKWYIINAERSIDDIAKEIELIVLQTIERVQYTSIGKLWDSNKYN